MGTDLQVTDAALRRPLRPVSKTGRRRTGGRSSPTEDIPPLRLLLFDELADEFLRFYRSLLTALGPKDALEEILVERVATSAWRLRRVYRIESGLFAKARVSAHNGKLKRTRDIELVFLRLTSHDDTLAKLNQYEASLERSLHQALRQLACQQRRRNGSCLCSVGGRFVAIGAARARGGAL